MFGLWECHIQRRKEKKKKKKVGKPIGAQIINANIISNGHLNQLVVVVV